MRILLTNTLMLNGGEAATVTAVVDLLRRSFGPETEIVVYEQGARAAARLFPEFRFRPQLHGHVSHAPRIPVLGPLIGRLNRTRFQAAARSWCAGDRRRARRLATRGEAIDLDLYDSADLVVSSGGTYLVGNYDIEPRLFDYELCLQMGKPLVFFTQSMGPFRADTRERLRAILDRALLILLRDEASRGHLRELGVSNPNLHLCADAVFALEAKAPPGAGDGAPRARPRIAVSVRNWHYFATTPAAVGMAAYLRAIAAAVVRLVRGHGAEVVFVSTCQGVPEYWYDDAGVAGEVLRMLPEDVRRSASVDGAFHRPGDLIALLQGFDLVIATRFHMAILAMLAGTPTVAVAYESKTRELYGGVGLSDWCDGIEPLPEDAFADRVERCFDARAAARPAFERAVRLERERALAAVDLLRRAQSASRLAGP